MNNACIKRRQIIENGSFDIPDEFPKVEIKNC